MTIHSEHPFAPDEGSRDPLRRLRGRLPAPVTVLASGEGASRAGLTVSSVLVADGDPARVLALVDEDSDWWDTRPDRAVVNVLGPPHAWLAEAFAGLAPAPGGTFTQGEWTGSAWGPVLAGGAGWLGVRLEPDPRHVGWGLLVEGVVEHAEVGAHEALGHVRGRYVTPAEGPGGPGAPGIAR